MASCEGKKRYDKKSAQTARNYLGRNGKKGLKIYQCDNCNGWHLTSHETPNRYRKQRYG